MPSLAESADRVVANSEKLQAVLRGEDLLLFPPGGSTFIVASMVVLFGWIAQLAPILVFWTATSSPDWKLALHFSGMALGAGAVCIPGGLVVLGRSTAHRLVCVLSRLQLGMALIALLASGLFAQGSEVGFRVAGLALWGMGDWLVRRPSYALVAAFFRAKRSYALEFRRKRSEILKRHA